MRQPRVRRVVARQDGRHPIRQPRPWSYAPWLGPPVFSLDFVVAIGSNLFNAEELRTILTQEPLNI